MIQSKQEYICYLKQDEIVNSINSSYVKDILFPKLE